MTMSTRVARALLPLGVLLAFVVVARPASAQYDESDGALQVSDTTVRPGQAVTVTGHGFDDGSEIIVMLLSTPRELGRTTANADGDFTIDIRIPSDVTGTHTIRAEGTAPDGSSRVLAIPITIENTAATGGASGGGSGGGLALTGGNVLTLTVIGAAFVLVGAGVVTQVRRRGSAD